MDRDEAMWFTGLDSSMMYEVAHVDKFEFAEVLPVEWLEIAADTVIRCVKCAGDPHPVEFG